MFGVDSELLQNFHCSCKESTREPTLDWYWIISFRSSWWIKAMPKRIESFGNHFEEHPWSQHMFGVSPNFSKTYVYFMDSRKKPTRERTLNSPQFISFRSTWSTNTIPFFWKALVVISSTISGLHECSESTPDISKTSVSYSSSIKKPNDGRKNPSSENIVFWYVLSTESMSFLYRKFWHSFDLNFDSRPCSELLQTSPKLPFPIRAL